jgi:multiple sugar transport system permease protein
VTRSFSRTILDIAAFAVLIIGALTMLIPFVWMISVSLREPAQQYARIIVPAPVTLQNYLDLFKDLGSGFSLSRSIVSNLHSFGPQTDPHCAMAAFVFAIVKFKDVTFALLIAIDDPSAGFTNPKFYCFQISDGSGVIAAHYPSWRSLQNVPPATIFPDDPRDQWMPPHGWCFLFDIFWRVYMPLSKPAVAHPLLS